MATPVLRFVLKWEHLSMVKVMTHCHAVTPVLQECPPPPPPPNYKMAPGQGRGKRKDNIRESLPQINLAKSLVVKTMKVMKAITVWFFIFVMK